MTSENSEQRTIVELLARYKPREKTVQLPLDGGPATFRFRAVPARKFDELIDRFPPTEKQWAAYRETAKAMPFASSPTSDANALAPELLALCCVEPQLSEIDARLLWEQLSEGDAQRLFGAAWSVNVDVSVVPDAV